MKRFRFRLQRLLQLERHRVHAARLALATELRQLAELDQRRTLMRNRIVEATDRYREAIRWWRDRPHEIEGRQRTLSRLQTGLHAADEEREGLQARVEECRHALAAVRAREQLLERRRDDARDEWRREADRVEADLIDEFLSGRKGAVPARSQMMKSFFSLVGMLTVALWVFVGLLHVFLNVQGKNSPETYQKLRGIPVIGGYFPDVKPETDEEAARRAEDKIRMDIASSSADMQMPRGWTVEQLEEFIRELKTERERLVVEKETLDEERRAAEELLMELDKRETTIAQHQEALDAKAKDLTLQRDLLDATKRSFEDDRDAKVDANLRRVAKVIENMKPQKAMVLLVGDVEGIEDIDERSERYRDAARLLAYLPAEASSAIMEQMTSVAYQRVVGVMKTLPLPTKG